MIFRDCLKLGTLSLLLITGASGQTSSVPRFTVSQVGLHFICTADGQPDMYSWRLPLKDESDDAWEGDYVIPDIPPEEYEEKSQGTLPLISGGRTALRIREQNLGNSYIEYFYPRGFNVYGVQLTNVDEVHWRNDQTHADGFKPSEGMIKDRFYSNYPPLRNPGAGGRYGTITVPMPIGSVNYGRYYARHPGYDWRNWNWTLDYDTPLAVNEKRLQAMLYLDLHTPPTTDPNLDFDLTFVVSMDDMNSVMVNGQAVFSRTEDLVIKTRKSLFENKGTSILGGHANYSKWLRGRRLPGRGTMPEDVGYDHNTQVVSGTLNMDAVSSFFTVNRDQLLTFASGPMTLRIYNTHDWVNAIPLQTIQFTLPTGQAPNPDLVTVGTYNILFVQRDFIIYNHPTVQAVRRWGFNRDGVLGRFTEQGGKVSDGELWRSMRGRLFRFDSETISSEISAVDPRSNTQRVPGALAAVFGYDEQLYPDVGQVSVQDLADDPLKRIEYAGPTFDKPLHFGTDTVRTIVNKNALIPKAVVTEEDWIVHPDYHDETVHLAYGTGFDLPEIVQGPVSKLIETLEPVTLAVSVESTTEVSYQWRYEGEEINTATGPTYTISHPSTATTGAYDVVVTNSKGSRTSGVAELTVTDPFIVGHPEDQTVSLGGTVSFAVTAEGTDLQYQWRRDGRDIPKATSAVLSLYKLKLSDQGIYDVVVTGGDGRVFSEEARLTVNPVLAIVQQPVGGTFQSGDEFKLVVKAVGPGPLGYQWRRNETDIDGATTDQLTLASVSDSTGTYDVIVKDANLKSVTSVKVKVAFSVGPAVIVEQPASQVVELGSEVQFAVSATGSNLSYQWRKNGVVIANARDSVLSIADVQKINEGRYDCVVTNGQMGILSEAATLQVGIPLVFLQEPEDQTVALGSTITFEALAEGEEVSYQWFFNDKALPGAIYNTVTVSEADFAKAGRYSVTATASGKTANAEAHLRIFEPSILIYKLTGTGLTYKGTTSQRVTLSGTLLVDKRGQEPRAAFILTRKEGRLNVFEVQRFGSGFHIATTGSAPKAQTAMTEVMGEESGARAVLWLQGADSLITLSKTASTLAPRTLSGSNQRLDLGPDGDTLESVSLKAALDTAGSAISRHLAETLDQTIQRLRTDLLVKGYVEIPEER